MAGSSNMRDALTRPLFAAVAVAAAVAGLSLAAAHPLAPGVVTGAFVAWSLASYLRPGLWLALLPATLPLLNLSPWTGWLVFDELDIAILSTVAAEFARLAMRGSPGPSLPSRVAAAAFVLAGLGPFWLSRGLDDAGGWSFGLFEGYGDPLNSVRIVKPLLWALLLLPLLHHALRDAASTRLALERLGRGMLCGLCAVTLAALWDRAAFPGLLDFSSPYRTVAMFWEMHVGGAAIDAYLALAAPFVAWRLFASRTPVRWAVAAVLALLTEYVCLTTFSRGVYLAVVTPLLLLGLLLRRQPRDREPGRPLIAVCTILLAALMVFEATLVLGSGTFMLNRIGSSERDFRGRILHWHNGLKLLQTPGDWLFGIGLGRLPSRYAATAPDGEWPGRAEIDNRSGQPFVRISGPPSQQSFGGLYGLTQRVPVLTSGALLVRLDVRAAHATRLRLSVCEVHLLYERNCQDALVTVQASGTEWQSLSARLAGPPLTVGNPYAPRMSVFAITPLDAGGVAELDNVSLQADQFELLSNGHFTQGLAHWFPVAKSQFLPWHIDNLYLEMLIERGLSGLILFLTLVGCALWNLCFGPARGVAFSPFLAASLMGAMTVGLVSSIMDTPRVAFLLALVLLFSLRLNARSGAA